MPGELKGLYNAFAVEKDIEKARDINMGLLPIMQAMFVETNPIPVKEALYYMGMIEREFRLPLCPLSGANSTFLKGILKEYGLLARE